MHGKGADDYFVWKKHTDWRTSKRNCEPNKQTKKEREPIVIECVFFLLAFYLLRSLRDAHAIAGSE